MNNKEKHLQFKLKDISSLKEVFKVINIMEQNNTMKAIQINVNNELLEKDIKGYNIYKDNELKVGEASVDFELI